MPKLNREDFRAFTRGLQKLSGVIALNPLQSQPPKQIEVQMVMKPTLGRIVHHKSTPEATEWFAAIVISEGEHQFEVNVFTGMGDEPGIVRRTLRYDDEDKLWRWPPRVHGARVAEG